MLCLTSQSPGGNPELGNPKLEKILLKICVLLFNAFEKLGTMKYNSKHIKPKTAFIRCVGGDEFKRQIRTFDHRYSEKKISMSL